MAWVVYLLKRAQEHTWKSGYFPRRFALKVDAVRCATEVLERGGTAHVEMASSDVLRKMDILRSVRDTLSGHYDLTDDARWNEITYDLKVPDTGKNPADYEAACDLVERALKQPQEIADGSIKGNVLIIAHSNDDAGRIRMALVPMEKLVGIDLDTINGVDANTDSSSVTTETYAKIVRLWNRLGLEPVSHVEQDLATYLDPKMPVNADKVVLTLWST